MTGIIGVTDGARALFDDYAKLSRKKFKEWLNSGEGYTRFKFRVYILNPNSDVVDLRKTSGTVTPTDIVEGPYACTINVVNAQLLSCSSSSNNYEGMTAMQETSQVFLMMSALSGGHTPILMQYYAQFTPLCFELISVQTNQYTDLLLDDEAQEIFHNSFLVGIDRDNDIDVLCVRFGKWSYSHKAKAPAGGSVGMNAFISDNANSRAMS